jgi:hypothetical protein
MLRSVRVSLALCAACVSLLALSVSPALAGSTVTVRIEGQSETLLPATQVTTSAEPVVKNGEAKDFCPGTSALGALQTATGGNWAGKWFGGGLNSEGKFEGLGYAVETIDGESHAFGSGFFWDLWINHVEAEGACKEEPANGAEVLFFPCSESSGCEEPLGVEVPATADVGEAVNVTVNKYNSKGQSSAVAGATITGAAEEAKTGPSGSATVKFSGAGQATLHVSAPELLRTMARVCVHNGNDGTCGTTPPTSSSTSTSANAAPATGVAGFAKSAPYTGPYALVARATDLIEDHTYGPTNAPRVLSGTVLAHSAVSSISLQLRRRYKGRCYAYNGTRERFMSARCGQGSYFKVSTSASYSYLLPAALAPGRYVLDIRATDASGNHTTLARGSSRIVFYVR